MLYLAVKNTDEDLMLATTLAKKTYFECKMCGLKIYTTVLAIEDAVAACKRCKTNAD
jgi:uncharacterized paraquat-inducible protein A